LDFAEAFKILEIEPTSDKKKIKVAYSKMLKKYHPEDFPEMFMKINEAYEKALGYAENNFSEKVSLEIFIQIMTTSIKLLWIMLSKLQCFGKL